MRSHRDQTRWLALRWTPNITKDDPMADVNVTRRDFIRGGAVATVGAALGLTPTYTVQAGNPDKADTQADPQLQSADGIPPLRQDRNDDFGRLHGRALEADRQGCGPRGEGQGLDRPGGGQLGIRQESPRCRQPLHRSRHQLHRRLREPGGAGLQQGAQGPPRQDVPGLFLVRGRDAEPGARLGLGRQGGQAATGGLDHAKTQR